jgi:NADPH:quinone reductase-like Zn-dependent oxidoreductase
MTLGKSNRAATPVDKKLVIKDLPYPVAEKGSIIIRNKVSGLNYADINQFRGIYPLHKSGILGLET